MHTLTLAAALAALVTGASGSLHCALMCGPLACASAQGSRSAAISWHVARLFAYALLGAALGAGGLAVLHGALPGVEPLLPWVMALGLVATALDVGKHAGALPGLKHVSGWLLKRSAGSAPWARAGAMGAATPFLPCGLVYGIALSALASGSAASGFAVMGAFALGAVPALATAQLQLGALRKRPRAFEVARRAAPLIAAAVLIYRALAAVPATTVCH